MKLEIIVPTRISSNNGDVHYRLPGEQLPLCSQHRSDWRIITTRERVFNYAKLNICMNCVEQKHYLEHNNSK